MTASMETTRSAAVDSVLRPYPYQTAFVLDPSRFQIKMWSRQTGKSTAAAMKINDDILLTEAAGGKTQWTVISRSLSQAREMALKIRDVARAIEAARKILLTPTLVELYGELEERSYELTFPGGSRVIVVSGNPDSAAGYTGNVLWDEAALSKWFRQLFTIAFPVVSTRNYKFIIITTPRPGPFQKRAEAAMKEGSKWTIDKLTIHQAIAQGCQQDAEELRAGLADELAWRQEFLCEFVDDDICWLPWELLVGATSDEATTVDADPEECDDPVYGGWDIARWQNLSVLWLASKRGNRLVTRRVLEMKRMPFGAQYDAVTRACRAYPNFTRLCIDQGGMGEPVVEEMSRGDRLGSRVEGVKFNGIKEVLAGDMRRVIEERNFLLPDDAAIRDDLHSVRCTTTAAGNKRFEGESNGSHADRFWGGALCVHASLGQPFVPFEFHSAGRLVFAGKGGLL